MKMMTFAKYLEKKYLDWQQEMGERKTIEEFGHYIGVSQGAVSLWMNGKREPAADSIKLLANVLGPEIYDVLGLERPDPRLVYIQQIWGMLPPESRQRLTDEAQRMLIQNQKDRGDHTDAVMQIHDSLDSSK